VIVPWDCGLGIFESQPRPRSVASCSDTDFGPEGAPQPHTTTTTPSFLSSPHLSYNTTIAATTTAPSPHLITQPARGTQLSRRRTRRETEYSAIWRQYRCSPPTHNQTARRLPRGLRRVQEGILRVHRRFLGKGIRCVSLVSLSSFWISHLHSPNRNIAIVYLTFFGFSTGSTFTSTTTAPNAAFGRRPRSC
jgi:hypothetical protein